MNYFRQGFIDELSKIAEDIDDIETAAKMTMKKEKGKIKEMSHGVGNG